MRTHLAVSLGAGALALSGAAATIYGLIAAPSSHPSQTASSTNLAIQAAAQDNAVTPLATISRAKVIANAKTWHPHTSQRVPYSQSKTHNGYRTDCSGYASMSLALGKPGLNTVGLANSSVTTRIKMSQLKQGDLIIDATGTSNTRHVVIFEKWANSAHSSYWEYEQRGSYGTDHRTRTYGLASGSEYHAYHPKKLV
ncbi:MAG: NlpC/P60 family protein [Actinoallomurus sp.]